jgi:hypothetical protein
MCKIYFYIIIFATYALAWMPDYSNLRARDSMKCDSLKGGIPIKADASGKFKKCAYLKDTSYVISGSTGDSVRAAHVADSVKNLPAIDSTRAAHVADIVKTIPAIDSVRASRISDTTKHQRVTTVTSGTGITVVKNGDNYQISAYSPPTIISLTNTEATHYAGETVDSLVVNWALSGATINYQTLTDIGSLFISDRAHIFHPVTLTSDKYYTLTVTDGVTPTSATTWVYFLIQKYIDTCSSAAPSEAEIRARASSWTYQYAQYRVLASTPITGGGKYIYYAYPVSFGTSYIYANGFLETWSLTTVSITNSYGDTRDYYVYTSPFPIAGTINLEARTN